MPLRSQVAAARDDARDEYDHARIQQDFMYLGRVLIDRDVRTLMSALPRKREIADCLNMSALCHKARYALQQFNLARSSLAAAP